MWLGLKLWWRLLSGIFEDTGDLGEESCLTKGKSRYLMQLTSSSHQSLCIEHLMYTKHSCWPHGRCRTRVWSLSSRRSCPARHRPRSLGTVLRQEVSFFKAEDSCCPVTPATFHTIYLSPNPDAWEHLQKSGKPSSDVNCNFILTYISEFVPCPAPPPPLASDQSRPPCDLYVALFGLDLWPSDAPDLEHWSRWSLQASTTPVYTKAHGSTWSHFYYWHWKLGPNYSGVNCIALSRVVGASVVCWLLWRVLRFYLAHDLTKFYCLSWTLRIKVNNKVH